MDSWKTKLIPHLIALAAFFVVILIFCGPAFSGKSIKAHDTNMHKGLVKEIADHREAFQEEPLWTNSVFGGMPAFQISVSYPKNLIKSLDRLPANIGLPASAVQILKFLIGFYILLMALKVPFKFAIGGAIAFALSSYFLIILEAGHNTKATAIAYVAPTLAGIILTYRGKYLLGGALTALFFALNLVANHVQISYYMGMSLLIFGAVEVVRAVKQKNVTSVVKPTLITFSAIFLGLLVNNTNLRLTADYVKDTQRGKSELVIKARQKKEKAELAERKRKEAIEEAKKQAEDDDTFKFNEANYLPPDKSYASRWSYGKWETFTLVAANFNGGGASDDYDYLKDKSEIIKELKSTLKRQGASKREVKKTSNDQFKQVKGAFYWGDQPGVNGPVYIGAGMFLLFLLGLFAGKSHLKWWLLGTAILGVLIAWGKNFLPFFNFMFDYFPMYNKFRAITMALYLTELAVPLLGFIFVKELIRGELDKEKTLIKLKYVGGSFVGLLIVFYVFGTSLFTFVGTMDSRLPEFLQEALRDDRITLYKTDLLQAICVTILTAAVIFALIKEKAKLNILAIVLALVSFVDLWSVDSRYFNDSIYASAKKVKKPFVKSKATSYLEQNDKSNFRVYNASLGFSGTINDASTAYFHQDIGGYASVKLMIYQDLLDFNLGQEMQEVAQVNQQLAKSRFQNTVGFDGFLANKNIMNMLNTKYIIMHPKLPPYKNENAYGNAWCVKNRVYKNSQDSVMFGLSTTDLRSTAILFSDSTKPERKKVMYAGLGFVSLKDFKSNQLTYQFSSTANEFVVFSEVFYKGWNAYIDGELVDHERVNYILRGLEVPKGEHKIEFKFEPEVYAQGENISLASSSLLLILFGFALYREFKKEESIKTEQKV